MLDTARHYLNKDVIKRAIDGMMFNKLNVLHWHIVDAESFPLEVDTAPELAIFGGYSRKETYNKYDIKDIIDYAHTRGIMVMPEISTPGHTASWFMSPKYKECGVCPDKI